MKNGVFFLLFFIFSLSVVFASEPVKVLVIDSGSDFTHNLLNPLASPNLEELNGKDGVDDDENGYIDDIYGWNFVENNNILVNLKYTPPKYQEVLECMRLLCILQAYGQEALTPPEFQFLVSRYQDKKFWAWIGFTGGWAHGTHCAGIIAENNPAVRLNAISHIPIGQPPEKIAEDAVLAIRHFLQHNLRRGRQRNPGQQISMEMLSEMFAQLGEQYKQKVAKEAEYIANFNARIINCSFGSDNSHLFKVFKHAMVQEWGWVNPTDEQVQQVVNLFVKNALLERDKVLFGKCKDALFFIAAGNSGENLDKFLSSPNDVDLPNKIVVAATLENRKLAEFSCYGAEKVDVAVPGVKIFSTVPNNQMAYMSGTSMAAPLAAKYASQVLQENPSLTPLELKKILVETVDKKDWLAGKVKSSGIINPKRAVYAAKLVKEGKTVEQSIEEAKKAVPDMVIKTKVKYKGPNLKDKLIRELYFSAVF